MWNQTVVNKVKDIYNGKCGSETEQHLIHDYLMFYGIAEEIGYPTYSIGYQSVMDMMSGKKRNRFIWIAYEGITPHNFETIYTKDN